MIKVLGVRNEKRWMTGIVASLVLTASFCGINTTVKATNYIEIPTEVLELEENDSNPAEDWEIINGQPEQIVGSQETIDSELGTEETKSEIEETEPEEKEKEPEQREEEPEQEEEDDFTRDQKAWSKAKLNYTYLRKGKTAITQLSIKKVPIETTDYTILWKSSNKKVATVDKEGVVTAIKVGSAIITCTVYVLTANQTAAIQVYNQHTNSKISYSSNATKIATVSSKGLITQINKNHHLLILVFKYIITK